MIVSLSCFSAQHLTEWQHEFTLKIITVFIALSFVLVAL